MATKPTRHTPEQADGTACVRCSRDFTTYSGPTIPVATVDGGQVFACVDCDDEKSSIRLTDGTPGNPNRAIVSEPESVRQAAAWADITAQIREITQLIRPVVDERYGRGTGALLAELVDALLSGHIDVEQFTSLAEALQRGDLAEVEQAVTR